MSKVILSIYDYFRKRPLAGWAAFVAATCILVASLLTLHYKEDISDFLPLDDTNHTALAVYQDISGANNIVVTVAAADTAAAAPDSLVAAVETFCNYVAELDSLGYIASVVKEIDMDRILGIADNVYSDIPYFLTEADYSRIDSLLATPYYVAEQLTRDKQMLLFPSSSLLAANISRDPLNLFSPVLDRIRQGNVEFSFETYDGYILSPDWKRAIIVLESAFGANESENNGHLVDLLTAAASATEKVCPGMDVHIIGGPAIAVTNARQIKTDSILAVALAGILILALLIYVFRSARNILLIVVSVGWGWLFAMGGIALFYHSISIIVIGIASIILGIAVNYPLHLIDHMQHCAHPKEALKEIISPLVVGNVTTVGAFLCLVPLNSVALHDLGLFSSLLLVGTILFVLIFLPQVVKIRKLPAFQLEKGNLITRIANISVEKNRWVMWMVFILTAFFGFFSFDTEFDSDMRNINFMTPTQRADLEYFSSLSSVRDSSENLYVVSNATSWDAALARNEVIDKAIDSLARTGKIVRKKDITSFLRSESQQRAALQHWHDFLSLHRDSIIAGIDRHGALQGFNPAAFSQFYDILNSEYEAVDLSHFDQLTQLVFKGNLSEDASRKSVVQVLEISPSEVEGVKRQLSATQGFDGLVFDVKSMNSSITRTLSDDFNYIGFTCGAIVFVFLWISLGSVELAIVSFLPMAVSWIWILGIMALLGIKFNIVNVILATFIFGQGDDYTIFMTEGLSYEFAYRRKLLASYKSSIIVSALIMFIGIGTLIFAKHPALRSLGEVTVVGMLSVVLMAYFFPPLVFNWLVRKHGHVRYRPITLKKIFCTGFCAAVFISQLCVAYVLGFFMFKLSSPTASKKLLLHRFCCSVFRWDVKRMPGIRFRDENYCKSLFDKPVIVISNHQSLLDSFYLMTLTPKLIIVANDHVSHHPLTGLMFRWLDFITVGQGAEGMIEMLRPLVAQGYSVAIFPEGERPTNLSNKVKRFHKGAFEFSKALGVDILPVYLHGILQAMPKGSALSNGGEIVLKIGDLITRPELEAMSSSIKEQASCIRNLFQQQYSLLCRRQDTVANLAPAIYDRYRYKGAEIERRARRALRLYTTQAAELQGLFTAESFLVVDEAGQGELALLLALMYEDTPVYVYIPNDDSRLILEGAAAHFVSNLVMVSHSRIDALLAEVNHRFFVSEDHKKRFKLSSAPGYERC